MSPVLNWGRLPRGDTTAITAALAAIDGLLAHPKCAGRSVLYRVDDSPLAGGRPALEAWLAEAAAKGYDQVRFLVDPRSAGPVVVTVMTTGAVERPG